MRRWLRRGAWLLPAAPFVLVMAGSRFLEPRIARALAGRLAAAASVAFPRVPAAPPDPAPPTLVADDLPAPSEAARPAARPRGRAPTMARGKTSAVHVEIASSRLMQLDAERLSAVRWSGVHDARGQAAGVRLSGVGALGVGLADGDVVTSIDGQPTRTEHDAVAAGIAAWTSGEAAAHATLLRNEQAVAVTVELPREAQRVVPDEIAGRDHRL